MTLFGKKGIDTSYERELFERRVVLSYPEKTSDIWLPSETTEEIQRAREFNISNVISGYEDLLERVQQARRYIEEQRKGEKDFNDFKLSLEKSGYKEEQIKVENEKSTIRDDVHYEIYSILFRLENSIEKQVDFQYDYYASQFIEGRSLEDLRIIENNSISNLAIKQSKTFDHMHHDEDSPQEDTALDLEVLAESIRKDSLLHITNGDISFSHLNRQADLELIVTWIENLLYKGNELIEGNMEQMIHAVFEIKDKSSLKTQLLVKFKDTRIKHENTKPKYKTVSPHVEIHGSENAYLQKKIKEISTENTMNWLYDQETDVSESFDGLGELLVDGIELSEREYEQSNGSMTQFYKSEANFFAAQLKFIQDKEKNRRYFRIIEDLEEKSTLDAEWVRNYLVSNGYKTSAES